MKTKQIPISSIKLADYNPRVDLKPGDEAYDKIKRSLQSFGLVEPLVWNEHNGVLIGGHQRLKVLKDMGASKVDVSVVNIKDPKKERALNIALNSVQGEFDDLRLAELLQGIKGDGFNLADTGLDDREIDRLLAELEKSPPDIDSVPSKPKKPVTRPGDLWRLGNHLVYCGDSTDAKSASRLFIKEQADMIFTDPPWNVSIGQDSNPKHRQRKGLENDNLGAEFPKFMGAFLDASLPHLKGDLYCVMGCSEWPVIDAAIRARGYHWSATIIWVKDSFVMGRSNYHKRFEPIWYGWSDKGRSSYLGDRSLDDVWEFPRPKASEEHPTMKPVELVQKAIENSARRGGLIFDPFLGSGTSLLAAEVSGRRCYGIEIDPGFCDVIIKRYEQISGKKAQRL